MMVHGQSGLVMRPVLLFKVETMPKTLKMTVTYLKMEQPPTEHIHPPANIKIALMKLEKPPVGYYRYLYGAVGDGYDWVDRSLLSDKQLAAEITAAGIEIYVAHVGGVPAGYFELDSRKDGEVWLAYFGIVAEFFGMGLGKWLLHEAISTAWEKKPQSVRLETCTLDHPRALPLYQRMGFVPYKRKEKTTIVPD